jgi:hypothetical protein
MGDDDEEPHDDDRGRCPATPTPRITRDRQGLLDALTVIDSEGWEGTTATTLLEYVRTEIVRPLAIDVGLRGAAASQAEATGWENGLGEPDEAVPADRRLAVGRDLAGGPTRDPGGDRRGDVRHRGAPRSRPE